MDRRQFIATTAAIGAAAALPTPVTPAKNTLTLTWSPDPEPKKVKFFVDFEAPSNVGDGTEQNPFGDLQEALNHCTPFDDIEIQMKNDVWEQVGKDEFKLKVHGDR